ncbi:MAG: hypothetical protein AAGH43_10060 [Pseudomonadota bacterium]
MTTRTTSGEPDSEAKLAPKAGAGEASKFQALTLDIELYQGCIDDPEMSVADKRELIETLWSIMVSFVDLGFGIHPLQQAQEGNASADPGSEDNRCGPMRKNVTTRLSTSCTISVSPAHHAKDPASRP